jgi:putative DNA primase/helicase
MIANTQNMRDLEQWVCWVYEERNGKLTKVPYSPLSGERADSTNPATWASLTDAVSACREHGYDGIGFVFTEDDPFCGVDIDQCRDPETEKIEDWAQEIIEELDSYSEVSPSGMGLHVLAKGELPPGRNRKGRLEVYDRGRYFTVTGRHLAGTPKTIEARQEQIERVVQRVFGGAESANGHKKTESGIVSPLSDEEIIEKACAAVNGEEFKRLWDGDASGYESASQADLGLCDKLAFWTGPDPQRIDGLFRQSGLYRNK